MLVKLLRLTAGGKSEIVQAVKAIRRLTGLGSIVPAKHVYDGVRDGKQPVVHLTEDYTQACLVLNRFFDLDCANEQTISLEKAMCLLTDANQILLLQGCKDEHKILVDLMRQLNDRISESVLEAKPGKD